MNVAPINTAKPRTIAKDLTGVAPRHEPDLERACVSEALLSPTAAEDLYSAGLRREHFWCNDYERVWGAFERVMAAGIVPDLYAIRRELDQSNELVAIGGLAFLARATDAPAIGDLAKAVANMRAMAAQRAIGEMAALLAAESRLWLGDPNEFAAIAKATVEGKLDETVGASGPSMVSMSDAIERALKHIHDVHAGKVEARGIPIHAIPSLSNLLGGLRLRRVLTIGADTGGGKSTLALQLATSVAGTRYNGEVCGVLVVSGEMDDQEQALRALQCEGGLTEAELFDANGRQLDAFGLTTLQALDTASSTLSAKPLWYVTGECSLEDIRACVRKANRAWKGAAKVREIVVDYLGIMRWPGSSREPRHERIAAFTKGLKKIAMDEGCHITLLAQYNRVGKHAKEATLSDFDGSGAIENDSDQILLVDRPNLRLAEDDRITELADFARARVDKSRVSLVGAVALIWDGARYRLLDASEEHRARWHSGLQALGKRIATR